MTELKLYRKYLSDQYTIGHLYIDDKYFCDVLEDPVRKINADGSGKIYGNTAIPKGKYDLILSMSSRFGRVLPEILNVPHFTGIRIHRGNTAFDTHGCLLVGQNKIKGRVINSAITENELMRILDSKIGKITIEIIEP